MCASGCERAREVVGLINHSACRRETAGTRRVIAMRLRCTHSCKRHFVPARDGSISSHDSSLWCNPSPPAFLSPCPLLRASAHRVFSWSLVPMSVARSHCAHRQRATSQRLLCCRRILARSPTEGLQQPFVRLIHWNERIQLHGRCIKDAISSSGSCLLFKVNFA